MGYLIRSAGMLSQASGLTVLILAPSLFLFILGMLYLLTQMDAHLASSSRLGYMNQLRMLLVFLVSLPLIVVTALPRPASQALTWYD